MQRCHDAPPPHLHLTSFRFLVVSIDPCLIETPTLFIYLCIYLFIYLCIYLFIYLFIYVFIYLFIYLSIYLLIYLFIYLFIQILHSYPPLTYCRGGSNSQRSFFRWWGREWGSFYGQNLVLIHWNGRDFLQEIGDLPPTYNYSSVLNCRVGGGAGVGVSMQFLTFFTPKSILL